MRTKNVGTPCSRAEPSRASARCNTGVMPGAAPATAGHGLALDNLRRRLDTMFGTAAAFELIMGPHHTQARLLLPSE